MYALRDDALFAIPTAEVPVTNLFREEILDGASLPLALTAFSACFRREAGSAGKDTRGLLRVHQFDKVELVRFTTPEDSRGPARAAHDARRGSAPAASASRTAASCSRRATRDSPARRRTTSRRSRPAWGSGSRCRRARTSASSRRGAPNIRYRPAPGEKPRHVHTLNGSGLGFPRTVAAILEHYQNADGSVTVPEVLRPYFGADVIR